MQGPRGQSQCCDRYVICLEIKFSEIKLILETRMLTTRGRGAGARQKVEPRVGGLARSEGISGF